MLLPLSLAIFEALNPILASAILPGWGENLIGRKTEARAFFVIEGSLWLSYAGFNYFGHQGLSSSRAFAVDHAGANPVQSSAGYFDALEDFDSSEEYNFEVERDASYFFPDDPVRQQAYIAENSFTGRDAWQWDTLASRVAYWQRRTGAREDLRRASFVSGFLVINRIVSVINVAVFSNSGDYGLDARPGKIGLYRKF